jgi:outer membrane immunogenic protein
MKKAVLTLTIFSALVALAHAGTEQYSGKEMKQVAPLPPACPTWTGFYAGAFGGYTFAPTDTNLNLGGGWLNGSGSDPFDKNFIEPASPRDLDTHGAELGGLLGYNYQFNKWVVGVEGAGGYLWQRDSDNTGIFTVPATDNTYSIASSFKTHYLVTVGPRIGYAFCKWLPYITGGLAIGDIDFEQGITEHNLFFHERGSVTDTQVGWMIGGGLEYAFTDHWHARLHYQYVDLGCTDFNSIGTAPFMAYIGNHEACLREHNVTAAIIFKF